jgi:hypothetical protein
MPPNVHALIYWSTAGWLNMITWASAKNGGDCIHFSSYVHHKVKENEMKRYHHQRHTCRSIHVHYFYCSKSKTDPFAAEALVCFINWDYAYEYAYLTWTMKSFTVLLFDWIYSDGYTPEVEELLPSTWDNVEELLPSTWDNVEELLPSIWDKDGEVVNVPWPSHHMTPISPRWHFVCHSACTVEVNIVRKL